MNSMDDMNRSGLLPKFVGASFLAFCLAITSGVLNAQTNVWQPSPGHTQIPIWLGTPPDLQPPPGPEGMVVSQPISPGGKPWTGVVNVSQPTMTVYSPEGTNTGIAALVFPGGGYFELAIDLEGTEICDWLNSKGITAVLLKYRVPTKPKVGRYGESPQALEDAQRTLGLVRLHAAEWHINPHKIGVIGFSAGGHMVAAMSTHFDRRLYPAVDDADKESCRPDFAITCYPGHLWDGDDLRLNPNVPVTTNTPPTFLLQAEDDHVDGVEQSLVYYVGLKKAGVPVEMHLYAQGGHGFGLRPTTFPISEWPGLVEKWLGTIGITSQ
jgi:acetyl esterase/lipase